MTMLDEIKLTVAAAEAAIVTASRSVLVEIHGGRESKDKEYHHMAVALRCVRQAAKELEEIQ